ncbi:MAG: MauE/DoxX family redox-associated membrane protein [Ilumatobacteraceae bacterium]
MTAPRRRSDQIAVGIGTFFTIAGVMHFANPTFFDDIVPPWLPPSERFWTYLSGVAELVVGPMLLVRRTRRLGGIAAMVLLVAVYPANLYMAWDWRDRPFGDQLIAYGRLPFQFLFLWLTWQVANADPTPDSPG